MIGNIGCKLTLYQLRGQRVEPMDVNEIRAQAEIMCSILGFSNKRRGKKKIDQHIERLSDFAITLDVVDDTEWLNNTLGSIVGHCDPSSLTIRIPERIYNDACLGDQSALEVIFHELGHLVLGHQPALHYSTSKPTQYEDSEWQADKFAEFALAALGYQSRQLLIDFY